MTDIHLSLNELHIVSIHTIATPLRSIGLALVYKIILETFVGHCVVFDENKQEETFKNILSLR